MTESECKSDLSGMYANTRTITFHRTVWNLHTLQIVTYIRVKGGVGDGSNAINLMLWINVWNGSYSELDRGNFKRHLSL